MICTATNTEYRSMFVSRVMPPKPAQLSPAIRARQQKLMLRRAELIAQGVDGETAAAQAFAEMERRAMKPSNVPKQLGGVRPCVLNGVEYPSRVEGARALGISEDAFRALVRKAEAAAKKDDAPVMTPAEVLAVLGSFEMTVEKIYRTQNTGRGQKAISAALERAVSEGLVEKRQCGKVTRYKAVRHG